MSGVAVLPLPLGGLCCCFAGARGWLHTARVTAATSSVGEAHEGASNCPAAAAAPAYQLQQYYVYGEVDDCFSKWTAFFDCLKKKTKYKEEVRSSWSWLLWLQEDSRAQRGCKPWRLTAVAAS